MSERSLKPGWSWVKFGDVVRLSKDRTANPEAEGIERYVGLEHIDPNDLRIRRWGLVAEGITFTSRFKPGQVLFGKRRAYQRKVAVADFEGVCSGDIYVFESANPKVLLPKLLPFICQTDRFFDRAVGTSAGSLSPRTNWTSLASFEFALPPLEEQRKIAQVLSESEILLDKFQQALVATDNLFNSLTYEEIRGVKEGCVYYHTQVGSVTKNRSIVPIGEVIAKTQYGLSNAPVEKGKYSIIRMMNLSEGEVIENDIRYVDLDKSTFDMYRLEYGDILFNRTNSYELVGRTGMYTLKGEHVFASYLIRICVNQEIIIPEYLTEFLNCPLGRRQVVSFATRGVSQANVNASNLCNILIPLPSLSEQRNIIIRLGAIRLAKTKLKAQISRALALKKNLLNSIIY